MVVDDPTFPIPGWRDDGAFFAGAATMAAVLRVVGVVLRAVVAVCDVVAVEPPTGALVVVVSPVTDELVVAAVVVGLGPADELLPPGVADLLPPPPHAAMITPTATTNTNGLRRLETAKPDRPCP